jgi:antitoxin (DNA-binding transcriptional repressor) of toxin-antitoxin stability system
MIKINMHEAKTQLSRLVEDVVVKGESFIIAKAGKPLVKVVRFDALAPHKVRRLGFLENQIAIPADFDQMGRQSNDAVIQGQL